MTTRRENAVIMEETVHNLRRLFQILNKQYKKAANETGLTGPQLWTIKVLSDQTGNAMTVSKLAGRLYVNSSTAVRILDGLEAKGLVQRVRSNHDRRIVYVSLTDKGGAVVTEPTNEKYNLLIRSLTTLSENKLHSIANSLSQLVNILDSDNILIPISNQR